MQKMKVRRVPVMTFRRERHNRPDGLGGIDEIQGGAEEARQRIREG